MVVFVKGGNLCVFFFLGGVVVVGNENCHIRWYNSECVWWLFYVFCGNVIRLLFLLLIARVYCIN